MSAKADEQRATIIALIILVGFVAATGYAYANGYYKGLGYPQNTFLFLPGDRFHPGAPGVGGHIFGDFFALWKHSGDANPYLAPSIFFPSNYLPFTHLLLKPATWIPYPVATGVFLISTSLATYAIVFRQVVSRELASRLLLSFIIAFLNYPFLTNQDRGNIDILMFVAVWLMLEAILAGRWKLAAVLLAVPVALKGTPALLALIFVSSRRWTAFGVSILCSVLFTLLGLLVLSGDLIDNAEAVKRSLEGFSAARNVGTAGLQHNSTVATMLEVLQHWLPWTSFLADNASAISAVVLLAVVLASLMLPLALWERTMLLTAGLTVVPAANADYRLVLMLAPLALALTSKTAREVPMPALVLLGLLMIPKSLPVLWADVGSGAFLNPLILLAIIGYVTQLGIRRRGALPRKKLFPSADPPAV